MVSTQPQHVTQCLIMETGYNENKNTPLQLLRFCVGLFREWRSLSSHTPETSFSSSKANRAKTHRFYLWETNESMRVRTVQTSQVMRQTGWQKKVRAVDEADKGTHSSLFLLWHTNFIPAEQPQPRRRTTLSFKTRPHEEVWLLSNIWIANSNTIPFSHRINNS